MEYRINRKTGDKIGVLGMGTSYIGSTEEKEAVAAIRDAYNECGHCSSVCPFGVDQMARMTEIEKYFGK